MTTALRTPPPDPGQLVEVRQRRFVVTNVRRSGVVPSPLQPGGIPPSVQHLVTLSSVEDDAMGEELQVVWEIEPGARVFEDSTLPEVSAFDDPRRLDAFLDAVRWGAVSQADRRNLQAPFRSGVEIEDYQLDPLVRALEMPRVNLLIADDVGLGKTIEAGLVAQELILRHRVRRILVVCPAGLQIQWRDQMRDKFGLEFRIVDAERLRELRRSRGIRVNPWTHFPRLITSIDYLKRERPMRLFREALPAQGEAAYPRRFDLLVLDEAHNVAPSGRGHYAMDSQRTQAIRALAPHFEHRLFLTATPHNGYPESFAALLELLDSQRFARTRRLDRNQLGIAMVRRLKSEVKTRWDGTPRFAERKLDVLEVQYPEEERRAHEALRKYTALRMEKAGAEGEAFVTEFVLKLLKKRLFSSPAAFATTLEAHARSLARAGAGGASPVPPAVGHLRRQVEDLEERYADDDEYEEASEDLVKASTRLLREPSEREKALLGELRTFATQASARLDMKAKKLLDWLKKTVRPGGLWGRERVIVFTEYRATQKWLHEKFAAEGLTQGDRLLMLHGGMRPEDRETIKAAFQADPDESPVRILLATDAASEGIDLQRHCHRLVHYEIPWNPNRMEQRNGRIDRHGQRAPEVLVYHFVGASFREDAASPRPAGDLDGDLEFLMRAALKVNQIREDLGKVGPVIAAQVEEAMLGKRRSLDTAAAEEQGEPIRRLLRLERKIEEQIARLRERLDETRRDLRLDPENIRTVVEVGLDLAGQPPLKPVALPGTRPGVSGDGESAAYAMPALRGSWAACSEGLKHPHSGKVRPIVFDHGIAEGRDDVVLVHLNHRLVQMCLRLLRAEIWSGESRAKLNRVTVRSVPDLALDAPAVIAHGRIVVLGGDNQRLHEEIIAAGGRLREGRFSRMNVGEIDRALSAAQPEKTSKTVQGRLAGLWSSLRPSLLSSLEARMKERTENLQRSLEERAEKEVADVRAILEELRRSIHEELADRGPEQLQLWPEMEREEFKRNQDALRARAKEIPEEIVRETAAIRARYTSPKARLFPVAVTFLVPEKYSRG
ncbi:MAG: DISARM system SNF2-like helicase DrmD [Planctomycetes bacterium]|nr:DISARM system SNF2-like helicase DrmD [Planctomycetota bacterium]